MHYTVPVFRLPEGVADTCYYMLLAVFPQLRQHSTNAHITGICVYRRNGLLKSGKANIGAVQSFQHSLANTSARSSINSKNVVFSVS